MTTDQQTTKSSSGMVWIIAAILIGVFLYRVVGTQLGNVQSISPPVGNGLPSLRLLPLTQDGETVQLPDVKGQVVLVNFWGTWCPPCRAEFPHIAALAKHYKSRDDFRLFAVSSTGGEDIAAEIPELRDATAAFLKQQGATDLPTWVDEGHQTRAALTDAGQEQMAYPTTFLLDRAGIIRGYWQGYQPGTEEQIRRQIEKLLAEKAEK